MDESEDEESKAENIVFVPDPKSELNDEILDSLTCKDGDIILQDVEADECSRILPLNQTPQTPKIDKQAKAEYKEVKTEEQRREHIEQEIPEKITEDDVQDTDKRTVYTPHKYENPDFNNEVQNSSEAIEGQNTSLLQLVESNENEKSGPNLPNSYEKLINSAIEKLESEENEVDILPRIVSQSTEKEKEKNRKETYKKIDESRLNEQELQELKNKCITRMREQKDIPIVKNPPILKDFSNSQKLLNFLDETEEKDKTTMNSVKRSSYNVQATNKSANLPSLSELLTKSVAELSEEVMTLKLELETERRSCAVLRTGLEQQQRTASENSKQLVRESKQRFDAQRHEYESAISRHQAFIDQLIDDKKSISQKCEQLTTDIRNIERRNKENVKAMESRHNMEMNRVKQINESSDRLKRERWMDQKAKKIKDQTVKSLESEVQKIMGRHATELSELKAKHKQDMEEQDSNLRAHFQKYFDQVKLEAERDKKEMAEQEKIFQLERFRKQTEQMEGFHNAEVSRLKEEIERERERREEDRHKWMMEAEHIRKIAKERGAIEVERVKEEMEEMRKSLNRRHANELTTFKANEETEKKEFERNVRERMEKDWNDKESHLRNQFTKERDQEIDRVIEKLEFEMKKAREDSEKSTEARIARLKIKHDNEIGELIKEIEDYKYKATDLKESLVQKEAEAHLLTSVNKQMEVQIKELESIKTKLIAERNDVAAVVRKEFADNLDMLTDENTRLKTELNHQTVHHKSALLEKDLQLRGSQNDFEKNINQLHEKVQCTIEKKEKVIDELRSQYEMAVEKISQLESIITQQSVDIVSKNKKTNSHIGRVLKNQNSDDIKAKLK